MNTHNISSICFMTASSCNLNCSFCYLHKNETFKKYDEVILQAWDDGSYLTNVKKSLKKLHSDTRGVEFIDFWGGETLLYIDHITPQIENLLDTFPNMKVLRISTNWMINIDNFIDFIKTLDIYSKKPIEVRLQLSIDGPPGKIMETGHNGSWDIYYKNIDKITDTFNNYYLNNVSISFNVNSVITKEVYFEQFSTDDGMINYVKYMKNFADYINNHCISKHMWCYKEVIFPQFALPYTETTEDGRKLADIIKRWETIRHTYFPKITYENQFFHGMSNLESTNWLLCENVECAELSNSFTFIPDGSIVQCSSSYLDHSKEYQQELIDNKEFDELQRAKRLESFHFNPSLMSEEELEWLEWYLFNGNKHNVASYIHMMLITADELALSGQIPYYFHENPEYLWTLLCTLACVNTCMRENIRDTGNIFIPSTSLYRRLLNGVMQYIYEVTKSNDYDERNSRQ